MDEHSESIVRCSEVGCPVCSEVTEVAYLLERNGKLIDLLRLCRRALIEVQGYLPTTYMDLVKQIDESGLLK